MKYFFLLIAIIILLASAILCFSLGYSIKIGLYHIFIMAVLIILLQSINLIATALLKNRKQLQITLHLINFLFLFLVIQFYILVISSNIFWGKTITFSIIKNYFSSLENLLYILPVEGWILTAGITFNITACIIFYYFSSKRLADENRIFFNKLCNFKRPIFISLVSFLVLLTLFTNQLIALKRKLHFGEEPFLQFTLGPIWGEKNEIAFDKKRYENGLKDESCTQQILKDTTIRRNIIVILIDALRSDHLPAYGYKRNTTPFLNSLEKDKKLIAVKNSFSTSTNTIGGIAGLFFSKGWNDFGFNGLSLMKYLKRSDYSTYAFLTGFHRDWYGLSALYRGNCDYYYESSINPNEKTDDDLVTLNEFEKTKLVPKSFIYIHLLSTHVIGKKAEQFRKYLPDKIGIQTSKKTALINNYDNGILQADYVIERIFHKLQEDNILQNSTVFILADHGELFGEDDQWGHGGSININLVNVPLLIYDQNLAWYKNTYIATLKDIAPTIADRIYNKVPNCWQGTSLGKEVHDFSTQIESVEKCDNPFGILTVKDSIIDLKVLDNNKQKVKEFSKTDSGWGNIK